MECTVRQAFKKACLVTVVTLIRGDGSQYQVLAKPCGLEKIKHRDFVSCAEIHILLMSCSFPKQFVPVPP